MMLLQVFGMLRAKAKKSNAENAVIHKMGTLLPFLKLHGRVAGAGQCA
jgi:hypothetical protein